MEQSNAVMSGPRGVARLGRGVGWAVAAFWLATVAGRAQEAGADRVALPGDMMSLREIVETGGWPMYVLGVMSVIGFAMVIYFLATLRERQVIPRRFRVELQELLARGQVDKAWELSVNNNSPLAEVAQAAIAFQRDAEVADSGLVKDIIEGEGGRQATLLQNQLQYLQDIAAIAPMIGLLGTVLGMLTAFQAVADNIAMARPMVLAAGVSQALITTAAGLIVGIPAMMAHAYFRGRASRILASLESASAELLAVLTKVSG